MEGNSSEGQQRRSPVDGCCCLKRLLASLHQPANELAHPKLLAADPRRRAAPRCPTMLPYRKDSALEAGPACDGIPCSGSSEAPTGTSERALGAGGEPLLEDRCHTLLLFGNAELVSK